MILDSVFKDSFAYVRAKHRLRCWVIFGLLFAIQPFRSLQAQAFPVKSVGRNTIVGTVTDTLGTPLDQVDVRIVELRRATRTAPDGTFRFDNIPPGTYNVNARSVGLIATSAKITLGADGGLVNFRMVRLLPVLASVVTRASAGGLSGVIGDTTYRAMAGVTVTVMGTSRSAMTDSTGSFFLALRPGKYMLQMDRPGYVRQLLGITVPEDEGRRVAAWMVPDDGLRQNQETQQLFDLNQRLMRISPTSARFFSREDLELQKLADLQALAYRFSTGKVEDRCRVTVNGTRDSIPLGVLVTSEIEFVEVYLPLNATGRGPTSVNNHAMKFSTADQMRPLPIGGCGGLSIVAWLRK